MNEERLLSISDAARALEIAVETLRGAANRGDVQCIRLSSGERVFRPADVEAYRARRQPRRQPNGAA